MNKYINLLPWREELKEFQKKQFILMIGIGMVVSAFILLLCHLLMIDLIKIQEHRNEYLQGEISILNKQITEITDLQKEKERLLARMNIIQRLQINRPHIVQLFDGLTRTVPEGLYLTNMTRIGSHVTLEGKAESNTRVSKFMRNIEDSKWLMAPKLSVIQAENPKNGERVISFNLQAEQEIKKE